MYLIVQSLHGDHLTTNLHCWDTSSFLPSDQGASTCTKTKCNEERPGLKIILRRPLKCEPLPPFMLSLFEPANLI